LDQQVNELESSLHLFQPPLYRYQADGASWRDSFAAAVEDGGRKLTWDTSAVLSIVSFGHVCGDRTLVNEVKRRPWMSKIGEDGGIQLEPVPGHGRERQSSSTIARKLQRLLLNEAEKACRGRSEIYLLLSGGLDSRIVAGTVARLYREQKIEAKPVCVTWGLEDSRDVVYARRVADVLDLEWVHIPVGPEDLVRNVEQMTIQTGALVSPIHLHCMHWFRNVSRDALVLMASYGDSVGRGEYSGKHILECDYLQPVDHFGLVDRGIIESSCAGLLRDLQSLRNRTSAALRYMGCEHELQGHYMRNHIAHVASAMGKNCSLYQMFTDPSICAYMWSIHPAFRNNDVYLKLLEYVDPQAAGIPWARTNRALRGRTVGARSDLREDFHDYAAWTSGPLFDRFFHYVDPMWFAETGLFDEEGIRRLREAVRRGKDKNVVFVYGLYPYDRWLWLAAFRRLTEQLQSRGVSVTLDRPPARRDDDRPCPVKRVAPNFLQQIIIRIPFLHTFQKFCRRHLKKLRQFILRRKALRRYPPESNGTSD